MSSGLKSCRVGLKLEDTLVSDSLKAQNLFKYVTKNIVIKLLSSKKEFTRLPPWKSLSPDAIDNLQKAHSWTCRQFAQEMTVSNEVPYEVC